MGWNVYKFSDKKNDYEVEDFEKALEMADEAIDVMCDVYEQMKKEYGKDSYKKREHDGEMDGKSYLEKRRMMRRGSGGSISR